MSLSRLITATTARAEAPLIRAANPLKDRYVVTFKGSVPAAEVVALATALAKQHGGRLLGTMKYAMRGFGIRMPEAAAIALSHNPNILQIEEDRPLIVSGGGEAVRHEGGGERFDFRRATAKAPRMRSPEENMASNCTLNGGGYYVCDYGSADSLWNLDRIDNTGLIYSTKAYAFTSTGEGVRAYVVDSGVWATHNEFEGAAPLVAGAIARLLQRYDTMTVPDVWAKLLALSSQHVPVPDFDRSTTVNQRLLYMSPFE